MMLSAPVLRQPTPMPMIVRLPSEAGRVSNATLAFGAALLACTSSSGQATTIGSMRMDAGSTVLMALAREQEVDRSTAEALTEIKRRSGLTWGQIARLFRVSRRAVHSWAGGSAVRAEHAGRVNQLLGRVRELSDLPVFKVREHLLECEATGVARTPEPPILVSDPTPFAHQLTLRPSKTRFKRG